MKPNSREEKKKKEMALCPHAFDNDEEAVPGGPSKPV